jgi:hypothetical protein
MPTPLDSALLAGLRPKNVSGQPSWTLITAQTFATDPSDPTVQVERTGVDAWSILGISIGSAPTAAQMAAALVKGPNPVATTVYYVEAWAQDGRVLGTGYVTWWYLAVYR